MLNRYICDVFEEMRKCVETKNFSYLSGLIEEAQTMANRMEAKLYDNREFIYDRDKHKKLKKKIAKLEKKVIEEE